MSLWLSALESNIMNIVSSPHHLSQYQLASWYTSRYGSRGLMSVIFIILFRSVMSIYSGHVEVDQATSVCSVAAMESSPYPLPYINQKNSNYLESYYWVRHHFQTKIYLSNLKLDSAVDIFLPSHFHHQHWYSVNIYHYLAGYILAHLCKNGQVPDQFWPDLCPKTWMPGNDEPHNPRKRRQLSKEFYMS